MPDTPTTNPSVTPAGQNQSPATATTAAGAADVAAPPTNTAVEPVKQGMDAVVPLVESVNEDLESSISAYLAGKDLSKVSAHEANHALNKSEPMSVQFERTFRSVVSKLTK